MNVGPVAVSAVLVLAGISQVAQPFTQAYVELVILTGLLVGLLQLSMGLMRMGFMVNFLSHPVLNGFIAAAAVIIIVSQLFGLCGLDHIPSGSAPLNVLSLVEYAGEIHWLTLFIGGISLVILFVLRRFFPKVPGLLLVVVLATLGCVLFDLTEKGVAVIGELPSGLPHFEFPLLKWSAFEAVVPTVLTVAFVGFVESLSIAKGLELKHRSYQINASHELVALGIAKIAGSFFQAIPSSGSFSRSAINDAEGAQSGLSSIASAAIVGASLLLLTPLFYYIPSAVLSAAIIYSVVRLIDLKEARYLWQIRRRDFVMMFTTFAITVGFGLETGILSGVILSLLYLLYQYSRPVIVELGNIPGTTSYRNINRYPEAIQTKEFLIIRFDNPLIYANASYFKDKIIGRVQERIDKPKYLILDASNIYDMDSTGLHALEDLYHQLSERKIQLVISGAKGTVRDIFKRSGFFEKLDKKRHFMYIRNAIAYSESDELDDWHDAVMQSNY